MAVPTVVQAAADEAIGRSAMRKAAVHLIPLMALGYGAAYIDRVNISFASFQMNRDLHFSATVYGFGAGLFFLAYSAFDVPSNLLLCRFGARRWLARIMLTWGILAIGMLFVRTPWQFYTVRFLLGMAEAGYFPGVVFYLMQWFPPSLRARTVSRFYIALPISYALMGLVAGALLNLNGRLGLAGWQWLFLIEGIPPVLLGIAFLFLLPDVPDQAHWLTEAERSWITRHVKEAASNNTQEIGSVSSVLTDPRVWHIGIFEFFMIGTSYGYNLITPQVIQQATLLNVTRVGFVTAGISLLGVPAMLFGAIHSDRSRKSRYANIIPWCFLMAGGLAICGLSHSAWIVVLALALAFVSFYAMQGPFWAIPPSFFTGRSSAAAIAAVNTIGITGGFVFPYYMGIVKDLTGDYRLGLVTLALPMLAAAGIMFYLSRDAKRRHLPNQLDHRQ
jgi:ACS family tartrate transporter-like MFS transporter